MIVFVDDDIIRGKLDVELYLLNKECNNDPKIELQTFSHIDKAWDFITNNRFKIKLFIQDIIMPPGNLLKDVPETHGNLRTGKVFIGRIRNEFPEKPIIVYTVVDKDAALDKWAKSLSNMTLLYKNETTPLELLNKVKQILGREGM
ncbi:MAG TPA: hypothetical protein PKW95_08560 [bacterium]|nr:hypothetical protein [bacterium]